MSRITRVLNEIDIRICQGDIYKNIEFIEYVKEENGILEISKIKFPYVVVLTQDCDLNSDFRLDSTNHDKKLISVIVAPAYNAEHVLNGEHLTELKMQMQQINEKRDKNILKQNNNPRYHYIEFPTDIPIVPTIIDFKHYFTVNIEYLKKMRETNFACRLDILFRELLSQRFANFLSRIGLPD